MRKAILCLTVCALGAVLSPPATEASTASISNGELVYTAGNNEANSITVFTYFVGGVGGVRVFEITDSGATITAGSNCSISANGRASCPSNGQSPTKIWFFLQDRDDIVQWTASAGVPVNLYGGDGADQLTGSGFDDLLDGGPGNDTLSGLGGNDFFSGGDGNDTLLGGDGNDSFESDDGDDTLLGGAGDDVFDAGLDDDGGDVITGEDGIDTTDYHLRTSPQEQVTMNGVADDGWWTIDLFRGLRREGDNVMTENVLAGSGASQLSGDANANVLSGNGGIDSISGGSGNDMIDGGAANDTLHGEVGVDTLTGGDGTDSMTGGAGNDRLEGGPGADNLSGEAGDDQLQGGSETDAINGGDGADLADYATHTVPVIVDLADPAPDGATGENDVLTSIEGVLGGQGNDQLRGDEGPNTLLGTISTCPNFRVKCDPLAADGVDVIDGRGGDDTINGGTANDTLLGGEGSDRILEHVYGGTYCFFVPSACPPVNNDGDDLVDGGPGNDLLGGGSGTDTVLGGEGDDRANGGPGANDQVLGGPGTDILFGGGDYALGGDPTCQACLRDLGDNVFGGTGADTLYGGPGPDTLDGEAGNDVLIGEAGDDVLKGGAGGAQDSDLFYGDLYTGAAAAGTDTVDYANRLSAVRVTVGAGADDGDGVENDSVAETIERVLGGAGGDEFTGNDNANAFVGNAGDDSFVGSAGNDTFDGGGGTDSLTETGSSFTLTDATLTGNGSDSLALVERVSLTGGAGIDNIDASLFTLGPVFLDGQEGNDSLTGGSADDELTGGTGVNALAGGDGADTAVASGDVNFTLTAAILTGPGVDALTAIERARLTGGDSPNTLDATAFSGSAALEGGGGDDILRGGAGPDVLGGGAGNDALNSRGGGPDTDACGDGNDSVISDVSDAVGADCESNDSGAPAPGGTALPTLTISNAKVKEGNRGTKPMTFLVQLSAASATPVRVGFKTKKGTAKPRSDFVGRAGVLIFAPGQTRLKIVVKIKGDRRDERNEKFKVVLANVVGATLLDAVGVGTIRDNDP